ncbi:uncharacterized protein LOC6046425 [Culex quinquefasciatus]|uniref:uncharacterized protein LOC6046425 n=1 Tax=Culex quinquefasciatus TaxID=7176 RepID=UPI0018E33A29|nr:uncharacterized protein LOC6046425 [Culex quinquefasciatus]
MFLKIFLLTVAARACTSLVPNSFEATVGCLQYNAHADYNYDHPYFATASWRNIKSTAGVIRMRMGVSGNKSGYIRLAPTVRPFDETTMHEIVLDFDSDNRSYFQRYVRGGPNRVHSFKLFKLNYIQKISIFEPLMFTVEVYPNGRVTVKIDTERYPFIDVTDAGVSAKYVGFANWDANDKAVFFVDCPLVD